MPDSRGRRGWRGVTLIQEFLDAGSRVACASDNVRDAFHPFGDFDALEVYSQSVRIAHLELRLSESVGIVTSAAADIVGLPDHGRVAPGRPAHLVILPGPFLQRTPQAAPAGPGASSTARQCAMDGRPDC